MRESTNVELPEGVRSQLENLVEEASLLLNGALDTTPKAECEQSPAAVSA
ncbi:MAG: hypothetical protein ACLQNE_20185 [Thermoguttaceae bacterium]